MNRIDRLAGTLLLLQTNRKLSAASIAAHWEISERTVYRDISALCEAGAPIVFEPGVGYRFMDGFEIPPVMFSEAEAIALKTSGAIAEQLADHSLSEALRTALLKIQSVLPTEHQSFLEKRNNPVSINIKDRKNDSETDCLIPMQQAIHHKHRIALHYDAGGKGIITQRILEPIAVIYYSSHWHLIAYCQLREAYRDFRMDRVVSWENTKEDFEEHSGFSLKDFMTHYTDEELFPIRIVCSRDTAMRLKEYIPIPPTLEEELGEDKVRLEFYGFDIEWSASQFLGWGNSVFVESPTELQTAIQSRALELAAMYKK